MKRWILFLFPLVLFSCKEKNADTYFTAEKAQKYFNTVGEYCNTERGGIWGTNLYGPLIFIDRTTRKMTANHPDDEGLLKFKDGVYSGVYPRELLINNGPVIYGGTRYSMAPLPAEEDEYSIITSAIHGLFHGYQQSMGMSFAIFYTAVMDEKDARLWLKLEWKALKKALTTKGEEQRLAIRDALIFRGSGRETFPEFIAEENRFESYEGLASFTYILLPSKDSADFRTKLLDYLDRIYTFQSYSRSYGFIHGALYGCLLYDKGFDFSTIRTADIDLAAIVKEYYSIDLPVVCRDVAGSIALSYDIDEINHEEERRLDEIRVRLKEQASTFTEKPVVLMELESPYFDYEPEDVHSLDTLGVLYSTLRVSDNWGKLTVEKTGCLVSNNFKSLRLTAKNVKVEKSHIYGEGWHLILSEGWELVEVDQNYFIRKLMP